MTGERGHMVRYVKYPVQSVIGGTLLLTLAFSLSDGSVARRESPTKYGLRTDCGGNPVARLASEQEVRLVRTVCLVREAKK